MEVYVARYAHQPRESIQEMPLSTFFAWHAVTSDMIARENKDPDE